MNNGMCFIGPHRKYNPFSDQFHQLIPGQGHFVRRHPPPATRHPPRATRSVAAPTASGAPLRAQGPDAIPGDARWRRGEAVSLKAARDSMVSLEVAAHAQMFSRRKL